MAPKRFWRESVLKVCTKFDRSIKNCFMQKFLPFARHHSAKVHRPPYFLPTESDLHAARKSFNVSQRIFLDLTQPMNTLMSLHSLFLGKGTSYLSFAMAYLYEQFPYPIFEMQCDFRLSILIRLKHSKITHETSSI